jgi:hypothetical protein
MGHECSPQSVALSDPRHQSECLDRTVAHLDTSSRYERPFCTFCLWPNEIFSISIFLLGLIFNRQVFCIASAIKICPFSYCFQKTTPSYHARAPSKKSSLSSLAVMVKLSSSQPMSNVQWNGTITLQN